MGAQERITAILRGSAARRVNFKYGTARVYGAGYEKMAELIAGERLLVRLETNQRRAQAMYTLGIGTYNHATNTFYVPRADFPGPSPFDSALVIHEMTHALMDWHQVSVTRVVSEAVAYTAQMMWLQVHLVQSQRALTDETRDRLLNQVTPAAQTVFRAAWAVAQDVYTTQGGYEVDMGPRTRALEDSVLGISIYQDADQETVAYDGH